MTASRMKKAPDGIASISSRNLLNRSALRPSAKSSSPGATAPEQTRLSAHRRDLQKKRTQRRTGVRMRYRRTIVRRSKKWMRQGDTPSWRQPANACCFSRALFVALFFAAFSDLEIPDLTPGCFASPTAFSYHLSFALRQTSSRPLPRRIKPEARLMRTTRRNLPMEMWRSTVSARA